jgi:thiamine-monophosphate kinase
MARAVSDIAAMGGEPRFALVSLGLARGTPGAWIKQLFAGLRSSARRFGVEIVGGDTAVGVGRTVVDITVAGEIPPGKALRRSGAAPGDQIFVSGTLGASAQGLKLLQAGDKQTRGAGAALVRSHLFPEPRLALGRFLREKGLASAALDLSDGLSTDLNRLCRASGVGARVWAELLPLSEGAGVGSRAEPREVLSLALHGGEDYELLFTVPVRLASQVPPHHCGLPLRRIGEILPTPRVEVALPDGKVTPLRAGGYDHFRKRNR